MSNQQEIKEEDTGDPSLPPVAVPVDTGSATTAGTSAKREPGDLPRELTCRPLGKKHETLKVYSICEQHFAQRLPSI